MKNLKKVLAFILVVAMMASLMISASALSAKDFTDYTEVQNKDAVAMLTELGIINGYPTGDFKPAGTVTRAEMAKMIYVVLNGGSDKAPTPSAQRYTDVFRGMWCEGYVAFCDDLGIIAGYGDGKFGPNDLVTGTQAAKMLLVAMGYNPAKEGFTGTNWDYNVLKVAAAKGLFAGFNANVSDGCTRDNAALLVYNALIADMVSYVGDTAVDNGKTLIGQYFGLVAVTGVVVANEYANLFDTKPLSKGKTEIAFIGDTAPALKHAIDPLINDWAKFDDDDDYQDFIGLLLQGLDLDDTITDEIYDRWDFIFEFDIDDQLDQETILEIIDFIQQKLTVNDTDEYASFVYNVSTDLSQVGKTVTVFAKLKGNYEQFTNLVGYEKYDMFSGAVVGNVVDDDACVVKTVAGEPYTFDAKEFKKEGYTLDYNTRYFENYAALWAAPDGDRVYAFDYSEFDDIGGDFEGFYGVYVYDKGILDNARGEVTQFIDVDHDGVIEIVLKTRQTFAVADYDKYDDTYTFDTNDDLDLDLVDWTDIDADDIVGDIKKGGKYLVTPIDGKYYVKECATVVGVPDEVDYNTDKEYYAEFDGVKYYESGLYWADDIIDMHEVDDVKPDDKAFYWQVSEMDPDEKNDYTCYLDEFGNIVAYELAKARDNSVYFLVTGAAYDVKSLKITDSVVFGAKAAKDTTIGVGAYYATRGGRKNTIHASIDELFSMNSIDGGAASSILKFSNKWQYVSYDNVLRLMNKYNVIAGDPVGQYTTLVKADFTTDDDEEYINSVKEAATDKDTKDLNLVTWDIDQDEINSRSDIIKYDDNGTPKNLYVGKNTIFYIYVRDAFAQTCNVISFTGIKNMPTLTLADPEGNDGSQYGIVNAYGVAADKPDSLDAAVVVFELNVGPDGEGKPVKNLSNWVYVYDVVNTTKNCQLIKAIDTKGELVELYNDSYYNKLDVDETGWFHTYASPDAECTKHDDHVVLVELGDDYYDLLDDVYYYDDQKALNFVTLTDISAKTHDDKYSVLPLSAPGPMDPPGAENKYNMDMSGVKLYIYAPNVAGNYDGNEIFTTSFAKVTGKDDYKYFKGANVDGYVDVSSTTDYEWFALTEERGPDKVIIAIIIIDETPYTAYQFGRIVSDYEVKASVEAFPDEGVPTPPPPPGA